MKKQIIISCLGLCLLACQPQTQQQVRSIPVCVTIIDTTESINTHTYVGRVQPRQSTVLSFNLGGRVTEVYCKLGQEVMKGQPLMKVDDTQQRNSLRAAKATLKQAKDGYQRVKKVYDKGGVPQVKLIDIETKLHQAQTMVDLAQQEVENTTLRAANNGIVSAIYASEGQILLPAVPAVEVMENEQMTIVIPVPEVQISHIIEKEKGMIYIPSVDLSCMGEVVEKDLTSSSPAHTYNVKLNILDSLPTQLLPDMVAKVQLISEQQRGIILPAECIQTHKNSKSVWVIVDGQAERRTIKTGMFVTQGVIVTKGLEKGDIVVRDGYQKLSQGAKIQIVDIQ